MQIPFKSMHLANVHLYGFEETNRVTKKEIKSLKSTQLRIVLFHHNSTQCPHSIMNSLFYSSFRLMPSLLRSDDDSIDRW